VDYLESLRRKAGHALLPLAYATALIRDAQGRCLFQRRKDFAAWGLPGGILEPGESPAACARRETLEETGLSVRPIRLSAVLSGPQHDILYPNGDRVQQTTFYFECAVESGSLRADEGESAALEFFSPDRIPPTLPWYRLAFAKRDEPEPFFDPPLFPQPQADPQEATWSMLRRLVGAVPLVLPGAAALIRDDRGRVLLVRRTDTRRWGLPGGLLELGETVAGTVIRETEEETGLRVRPVRIRGVFGGQRVEFPGGDVIYPISTWFDCDVRGGTPRPDGIETEAVEFHSPAAFPELVPGLRERLSAVENGSGKTVF
jgi:ADP-ribose pyrophosphatase YjhB (NUDIX family)